MKPVYRRFLDAFERIDRASIVTTNVDEALERALPRHELIQREDLSRAVENISSGVPFVAKLHGSISSIETTVFKTSDYEDLVADSSYVEAITHILASCCVIFIGYGVRDSYVVEVLSRNKERSVWGWPTFLGIPAPKT